MKLSEYRQYDGMGLSQLLREKQISPKELLDISLLAIEEVNPTLNFLAQDLRHSAASQLIKLDLNASPLAGVPILIKDLLFDYEGTATRNASKILENNIATKNSALADAYISAGLIFAGKSTTSEFGITTFTQSTQHGDTRNPWDSQLSPGGSSGGSGAAVASGAIPIGHCADGGCSIRAPAAHCGLVGLKPSRGRVSNAPAYGVWHGLFSQNALTRTVRDTAAMLDIATQAQGALPEIYNCTPAKGSYLALVDKPLQKLKIAVCRKSFFGSDVDPEVLDALDHTVALLESAGHYIEEASPQFIAPDAFKKAALEVLLSYFAQSKIEISLKIGRPLQFNDVECTTWTAMRLGELISNQQLAKSKQLLYSQADITETFHQTYDLLLTPTLPILSPKNGALRASEAELNTFRRLDRLGLIKLLKRSQALFRNSTKLLDYMGFTAPFSCTGQPAISLPMYWHEEIEPIGVQFVASFGREDLLIQIAAELERMQPWVHRHPPVDVSSPP